MRLIEVASTMEQSRHRDVFIITLLLWANFHRACESRALFLPIGTVTQQGELRTLTTSGVGSSLPSYAGPKDVADIGNSSVVSSDVTPLISIQTFLAGRSFATKDQHVSVATEPQRRTEASGWSESPITTESLNEGEPPKTTESLNKGESPITRESLNEGEPQKTTESLNEGESSKTTESLNEGESPKTTESLNEGESPKTTKLLNDGDSPKMTESPNKGESTKATGSLNEGESQNGISLPDTTEPSTESGSPDATELPPTNTAKDGLVPQNGTELIRETFANTDRHVDTSHVDKQSRTVTMEIRANSTDKTEPTSVYTNRITLAYTDGKENDSEAETPTSESSLSKESTVSDMTSAGVSHVELLSRSPVTMYSNVAPFTVLSDGTSSRKPFETKTTRSFTLPQKKASQMKTATQRVMVDSSSGFGAVNSTPVENYPTLSTSGTGTTSDSTGVNSKVDFMTTASMTFADKHSTMLEASMTETTETAARLSTKIIETGSVFAITTNIDEATTVATELGSQTFRITFTGKCEDIINSKNLTSEFKKQVRIGLITYLDLRPWQDVGVDGIECGSVMVTIRVENVTHSDDVMGKIERLVTSGNFSFTIAGLDSRFSAVSLEPISGTTSDDSTTASATAASSGLLSAYIILITVFAIFAASLFILLVIMILTAMVGR